MAFSMATNGASGFTKSVPPSSTVSLNGTEMTHTHSRCVGEIICTCLGKICNYYYIPSPQHSVDQVNMCGKNAKVRLGTSNLKPAILTKYGTKVSGCKKRTGSLGNWDNQVSFHWLHLLPLHLLPLLLLFPTSTDQHRAGSSEGTTGCTLPPVVQEDVSAPLLYRTEERRTINNIQ